MHQTPLLSSRRRTRLSTLLVDELTEALAGFDAQNQFSLDKTFLNNIGMWRASKTSTFAKALELDVLFKRNDPDLSGDGRHSG